MPPPFKLTATFVTVPATASIMAVPVAVIPGAEMVTLGL